MSVDAQDKDAWLDGMTDDEKAFEDHLRALVALLDSPHPGISSWHTARIDLARKIYDFLSDKFCVPWFP